MTKLSDQELLSLAKNIITVEAETLTALSECVGKSFLTAVRLINISEGRVIVTGMGKSALIAQKIVATLNSTGTPALFMHAADAVHGDLGMLQSQDILMCLSKSGETSEIRVLIPILASRGNKLIAIVAEEESYLSRHANVTILTPVKREADPNNLAPTSSTIAQLAVGDAIAMTLATMRDFKPEDFAVLHPGGMLGKKLHLTVGELSERHAKPLVDHNATIKEVILEISSKRLGATAVLNDDGQLCGIITDGDLRRMMQESDNFHQLLANDIMGRHPKQIFSKALASQALLMMRNHNITQLLVVEDGRYSGVIHIHDILKEGIS